MNETHLQSLIETLIGLGENEQELRFWERIFPSLDAVAQEKLIALLAEEVTMLTGPAADRNGDSPAIDRVTGV